jgi:hypothetical protein
MSRGLVLCTWVKQRADINFYVDFSSSIFFPRADTWTKGMATEDDGGVVWGCEIAKTWSFFMFHHKFFRPFFLPIESVVPAFASLARNFLPLSIVLPLNNELWLGLSLKGGKQTTSLCAQLQKMSAKWKILFRFFSAQKRPVGGSKKVFPSPKWELETEETEAAAVWSASPEGDSRRGQNNRFDSLTNRAFSN